MEINNPRIGIIDDHATFRHNIASIITKNSQFIVVVHASNGLDFLKQFNELDESMQPGIILTDVNMPQMDGFQVVQWMNITHSHIKTVVLSMNTNEKSIIRMLNSGASAYLNKTMDPKELLNALEIVAGQGHYFKNLFNDRENYKTVDPRPIFQQLTHQQKALTMLLCADIGTRQIAVEMRMSYQQLTLHQSRLFELFQVSSRAQLTVIIKIIIDK